MDKHIIKRNLEQFLCDTFEPDITAACELLDINTEELAQAVDAFGIDLCPDCKSHWHAPKGHEPDYFCDYCLQLGFAEHNLEFMQECDSEHSEEYADVLKDAKKDTVWGK